MGSHPKVQAAAVLVMLIGLAVGAAAVTITSFIVRSGELSRPAFIAAAVPAGYAILLVTLGFRMFSGSLTAARVALGAIGLGAAMLLFGSIGLVMIAVALGDDGEESAVIVTVAVVALASLCGPLVLLCGAVEQLRSGSGPGR